MSNIHIWGLPEKVNNVDKYIDITMIHDKYALKKIKLERLFEYFEQNYKIDNTVSYFETVLELWDNKYNSSYNELKSNTDLYDEIITNLHNDFTTNRNNIRRLETSTNQNNTGMKLIDDSHEDTRNSISELSKNIAILQDSLIKVNQRNSVIDLTVKDLESQSQIIEQTKNEIESDNTDILASIERISKHEEHNLRSKAEELSMNINKAYDRIVSIIDSLHHHNSPSN